MSERNEVASTSLLANLYLVSDGKYVHAVHADNWTCGGNGLTFERDGKRVAWFVRWDWWKRADA